MTWCPECDYPYPKHAEWCGKKPLPKLVWRKDDNGKLYLTLTEETLSTDLPFEYYK